MQERKIRVIHDHTLTQAFQENQFSTPLSYKT